MTTIHRFHFPPTATNPRRGARPANPASIMLNWQERGDGFWEVVEEREDVRTWAYLDGTFLQVSGYPGNGYSMYLDADSFVGVTVP